MSTSEHVDSIFCLFKLYTVVVTYIFLLYRWLPQWIICTIFTVNIHLDKPTYSHFPFYLVSFYSCALNFSFNGSLLVIPSLSFHFSELVFISFSPLKNIFVEYRMSGGHFSFTLKIFYFLASAVSTKEAVLSLVVAHLNVICPFCPFGSFRIAFVFGLFFEDFFF